MRADDVMTWASALFLLGMAGFVVACLGLIWAALSVLRRLDPIIALLERGHRDD
jgi:hypothetical protein